GDVGVLVDRGTGNAILGNSISGHPGLGIKLTNGGNHQQPFPVLTSATSDGSSLTILGTLTSTHNTTFTIELFANTVCNPSGFGEGEMFLGRVTVMTNGSGNATFTFTVGSSVPVGQFISATATDPVNNTSQFAQCVPVTGSGGGGGAGSAGGNWAAP